MKQLRTTLFLLLSLLTYSGNMQAQTLAEQYWQLLSAAQEAYYEAVGYRVGDEIPLTADQLSSNASDWKEGQYLSYLLDGDPSTFWHSDWHNQVLETHYIQIDLAEPVSCDLSLYVLRRQTARNHVTRVGLLGSSDGNDWTRIGQYQLGNASSGQEFMTAPLPLNGVSYSFLRLTIEETIDGNIYGHFAEIRLYEGENIGPSYLVDLGSHAVTFKKKIDDAAKVKESGITIELLVELQQAYDAFTAEFERIKGGGVPSFVQYTNLPSLFINTYNGSAITSKTSYQYAKMWRVEGDSIAVYDSLKIRGRGNSTWGLEKKPYRIKFQKKQKFLGKHHANAKNWTLMANHVDKTLLRNALASFIAKRFGQTFVPSALHVDVALNGEYLGNYQISDHMDVHKRRVEIYEQEYDETDEDADITGGYLLQLDGSAGSDPVNFRAGTTGSLISIKSPDEDVIFERQKQYIKNYVDAFETTLFGSNYTDPELGYRSLVDSLSLVSYFLTVEYCANADGYYSIYFYKDLDDPVFYWGPCWDYDIAFNNCNRLGEFTNRMMINSAYGDGKGRSWFSRFFSDPWFKQLSGRVWHNALADGLVHDALAFVDSVAQHIDESQQLNFQRWSITQRTWDELMLFSTYQEGVDYLKQFLVDHATYLSTQLPTPDDLQPIVEPTVNPLGLSLTRAYYIYNVGSNNPVDFLDDGSNLVCGWEFDVSRKATQQWRIEPITGDYYRIVSPDSRFAITDMAIEKNGSYLTGTQLQVTEIDTDNDRQLWRFVPTSGNFCIENKQTMLAWNNSHGLASNGNPILSWTNNADNASKTTRQWYIAEADELPDEDPIAMLESEVDYRITYNPASEEVLIRIPTDAKNREGVIRLYDMQGRHINTGTIEQPISMAGMPRGIYMLRWTVQGHSRSLKFLKP